MIEMERECPHKISNFQAHPKCQQQAMICEEECQPLHDPLHITQPADEIRRRYHKMRDDLKVQIRKYSDLLKSYLTTENEVVRRLHEDNTKLMEKQLLMNFLLQIGVERNTMDKIYGNRVETLKCCEVYSLIRREKFMEEVDWQKMDIIFKQFRKKEIYQGKPAEGEDVDRNRSVGVDIELIMRERDILSRELEALREEMVKQESLRMHAETQRSSKEKARVAKPTLTQKTFNICKVKTRKIKKSHREPQHEQILLDKQPLQPEEEQYEEQSQQQPIEQERPIEPPPANGSELPPLLNPPGEDRSESDSDSIDWAEVVRRKALMKMSK